jgi:hypothetical protein
MLLEATCRRWANDLAPYGRSAMPPWSLSATASFHDPCQGPQSQSPSLDHKCAFSQRLEMRAHWSMGPQGCDKWRTCIIHTLWHVWHASTRKREDPPIIGGVGRPPYGANQAQLSSTASMHGGKHPTTSTLLINGGSRLAWINGYEAMSPGSMTWRQSSSYSTSTYK